MRERIPLALLLAFAAPAQSAAVQTTALQARLEGQVIDPLYEPVANAEVVIEHDGVVVARTRSDGNGTFVVPRVPAQFVVVHATTDAPDIGAALVDLWGEHRGFVQVRTGPARRLSGVVRDDAGAPVANAWVLTSPTAHGLTHAHCRGRTDANGHYELTHVAMGSVSVRAWTDTLDAEAFDQRIHSYRDDVVDCTVTRDAAAWQTFVLENATDEQLARAELRVLAFDNSGRQMPLPAELTRPAAIEPGRFEIRGWTRADQIGAWVVIDGVTMWPGAHWIAAGVGTTTRRFRCGDPDGTIAGRLRQADGEPAPDIALLLQPLANPGLVNCQRRVAITGADGSFVVQSPVDGGDRFALRSMTRSSVVVGNDPNPVWFVAAHAAGQTWDLAVRSADSIRLRLASADGAPAPGVRVAVDVVEPAGQRNVGVGISGLDGSVAIDCLALVLPTTLAVSACGPSGQGKSERQVGATTGLDFGSMQLSPAAALTGTVVDASGTAVPGAQLVLTRWNPRELFATTSDRAGRFLVRGLEPGNYTIVAAGPQQPRAVQLRVDPGTTTEVPLTIIE